MPWIRFWLNNGRFFVDPKCKFLLFKINRCTDSSHACKPSNWTKHRGPYNMWQVIYSTLVNDKCAWSWALLYSAFRVFTRWPSSLGSHVNATPFEKFHRFIQVVHPIKCEHFGNHFFFFKECTLRKLSEERNRLGLMGSFMHLGDNLGHWLRGHVTQNGTIAGCHLFILPPVLACHCLHSCPLPVWILSGSCPSFKSDELSCHFWSTLSRSSTSLTG